MKPIRTVAALSALLLAACDSSLLEEQVYSEFGPTNFFRSEQDAEALVFSAYDIEQDYTGRNYFLLSELPTDLMIERAGGLEREARPIEDFVIDASHPWLAGTWSAPYRAIYRANLAIDRIPEMDFPDERKQRLVGEARFLRAESYMLLFDYFGPVPLITSSAVDATAHPARATEAEISAQIAEDLRAAAGALPVVQVAYGRATRGAALGLLARHHLNRHEWQQAADAAKEVMDLGAYSLFDAPRRGDLFRVENERNPEFIHVHPYVTNMKGNAWLAHAAPPSYRFQAPPKTNFAAQYKTPSAFLESFHPEDQRKDVIITEYINTSGVLVQLGRDDARSFKYQEDLEATGSGNGNDIPLIRYADVLLMRAEALNELQGPNPESVALINQVREKAGVPPITLGQFPSREALRDHILAERGWEFFSEGLRRSDLIRHGKYISSAQARGKAAQAFRVRYPIPQSELDKNPNLQQNEGY